MNRHIQPISERLRKQRIVFIALFIQSLVDKERSKEKGPDEADNNKNLCGPNVMLQDFLKIEMSRLVRVVDDVDILANRKVAMNQI